MTYDSLKEELLWRPETPELEGEFRRIVVGGMGGSALPSYAARFLAPALPFSAHHDYDLPEDVSEDTLYVAISYSGNTEETLSFANAAKERGLPLATISSGGELATLDVPHVAVPSGLQPREALFYQLHALLTLTGYPELSEALRNADFEEKEARESAKELAENIGEKIPLFYTSRRNGFLARGAKIIWNETAKAPAYANVFPELNHNEMQSFDVSAPKAAKDMCFVLCNDAADDPRVIRRMEVFASLMNERGRTVIKHTLPEGTRAEMLARMWYEFSEAAKQAALSRGADPESVPLVEEFKKAL